MPPARSGYPAIFVTKPSRINGFDSSKGTASWKRRNYKTALIVGAGEGLSASLARLFAREGIRVALAARGSKSSARSARETGARAFACNATEPDDVERLFGLVEREIGTPDLVVYNASARARGAFVDLVPPEWRRRSRSARSAAFWWRSRR